MTSVCYTSDMPSGRVLFEIPAHLLQVGDEFCMPDAPHLMDAVLRMYRGEDFVWVEPTMYHKRFLFAHGETVEVSR